MKKYFTFLIFGLIAYQNILSNESTKLTLILVDNCFNQSTKVYVEYYDYLLKKRHNLDSINLDASKSVQSFNIKVFESLNNYFIKTENNDYMASFLCISNDSIAMEIRRDTTGYFKENIIFQKINHFNEFFKSINWLIDSKYNEIFAKKNIKLLFEYSDNIYKSNLSKLNKLMDTVDISDTDYKTLFGQIKYSYYNSLARFLYMGLYLNKIADPELEYYNKVLFNNDTVNIIPHPANFSSFSSYVHNLRMVMQSAYIDSFEVDNVRDLNIAFTELYFNSFKGEFRDKIIYDHIESSVTSARNYNNINSFIELINNLVSKGFGKNYVDELFLRIDKMKNVMPGSPIYDYEFTNIDGNQ